MKKLIIGCLMIAGYGSAMLIVVSVVGDIIGMLNMMKLVGAGILWCIYGSCREWLERQPKT